MPNRRDHLDFALFENAPVAIWHEDFSDVKRYLDDLRASGVTDIGTHLAAQPGAVRECVRRIRVLHVNRLARDFYGAKTQDELVGKLPELFDAAALDIFRRELAALADGATSFEAEVGAHTLQGDERIVQMNVSIMPTVEPPWSRVFVVFTDLTERKRLEDELLQAQKLESLGRFAGGVAHDLNNALTVISGYSDLLLAGASHEDSMAFGLTEIKKAVERAAGLTQQLLAFSRKQVLQPKVVNLNTIVGEAENVLKTATGEQIELTTLLDPDLESTRVDPAQFYHVVLNLVLNARDAMPEGGKLEIRTANVEIDEGSARHLSLRSGKHVMLTVTDTGSGMDQETQRRAFDPFFTTKAVGKGTGLGLSSAFGFIQQSSGTMKVASEPGRGSTFTVYLPATDEPQQLSHEQAVARPTHGSETILLVEDQAYVRAFVTDALARYGYRVIQAADAGEALACFERHGDCIDLVVTDVIMPGKTGPQLVDQMWRSAPHLRVLYISGYTDSSDVVVSRPDSRVTFLQKPFALDVLASTVRELLTEHPTKQ